MDPNATLEVAREALEKEDFEEAASALVSLARWIERGGFAPTNYRARLEELETLF